MIYMMRAEGTDRIKIGWSVRPAARLYEVRPASDVDLTIVRLIDGPRWAERWFHRQFVESRLEGEWFRFDERMLSLDLPMERPVNSKRYNGKTTTVGVRVPNEVLAVWQVEAQQVGLAISAYVLQRAQGGTAVVDRSALDSATARADAAERRLAELESRADKIVPIRTADKVAAVGQLLITLPPEVIQLMPGDDKVATIEAHLIERFGYGMYRVKQLLKPEDKKGKRP